MLTSLGLEDVELTITASFSGPAKKKEMQSLASKRNLNEAIINPEVDLVKTTLGQSRIGGKGGGN